MGVILQPRPYCNKINICLFAVQINSYPVLVLSVNLSRREGELLCLCCDLMKWVQCGPIPPDMESVE
jgi:hypothetical protein